MSCIDVIITDQPNMFVESGVHPSLDEHCQHQVIYGKLNMSLPYPALYKQTVWDYQKADIPQIRDCLQGVNWELDFSNQGSEEMTNTFTKKIYEIMSKCLPNCVIKCDEKDPPWITQELKTAIKRKHVNRGRRPEDWAKVKEVRNSTSKMITDAKQKYHITLGRKLTVNSQDIEVHWSVLKKLSNKKKIMNIPPLLENGLFVTNIETKATILNDYFVAQCSVISTGTTLPTFLPRHNQLLHGLPIDRGKVRKLIRSLDSKKAHGCDEISIMMIKICDSLIVEPLCLIFEKCLATGVYPSIWKKANIIPVHKKKNRQHEIKL